MQKKHYLFLCLWLIAISITGCGTNNKTTQNSNSNGLVQNEKSDKKEIGSISEADEKSSDLVYREYKIGDQIGEGKIIIKSDDVNKISKDAQSIVVFYNDEKKETLPYTNEDIEYEIIKHGFYGFFVIDSNGEMLDTPIQTTSMHDINNDIFTPLD